MGLVVDLPSASTECDPIVTNADMGVSVAFDGVTTLNQSAVAIPCGLIAKSVFNDTF
jgi:hypothetical protein